MMVMSVAVPNRGAGGGRRSRRGLDRAVGNDACGIPEFRRWTCGIRADRFHPRPRRYVLGRVGPTAPAGPVDGGQRRSGTAAGVRDRLRVGPRGVRGHGRARSVGPGVGARHRQCGSALLSGGQRLPATRSRRHRDGGDAVGRHVHGGLPAAGCGRRGRPRYGNQPAIPRLRGVGVPGGDVRGGRPWPWRSPSACRIRYSTGCCSRGRRWARRSARSCCSG